MPILGTVASQFSGKPFAVASFESIATVTVGSGGSASVSFTSIPATYTHLQVRYLAQSNRATYNFDEIYLDRINTSTSLNTATHRLYGGLVSPGTTPVADGFANYDGVYIGFIGTTVVSNTFGVGVIDILDYTNTNKNKTFRALAGADTNGFTASYAPAPSLMSGFIDSTSAITSFRLRPVTGTLFTQYSHFALYGIKGA